MPASFHAKEQDPYIDNIVRNIPDDVIERRKQVSFAVSVGMMAFFAANALGFVAVVAFCILYVLKTGLGINVFDDLHLLDLVQ